MNSSGQRSNPFIPLTAAVSDTLLQMRAKPLIFLIVWFLLALIPLLLFDFALQQLIPEMAEQNSRAMLLGFMAFLVSLAADVYLYSVLGDAIAKLRKKLQPRIEPSLVEGLRGYVSLLKVVLATTGRILVEPIAIMILGVVIIGLLKQQETLLYWVVTVPCAIMLFINLLRYGLAPFVHLSSGIIWRSALAVSKSYYRAHRLRVLVLFGFVTLLPSVILYPLSLAAITGTMGILSLVLQSILKLFMSGVLINFGMNNFIPESSDEGGDDSRQVEAPLSRNVEEEGTNRVLTEFYIPAFLVSSTARRISGSNCFLRERMPGRLNTPVGVTS